jgi:hypothetical protein
MVHEPLLSSTSAGKPYPRKLDLIEAHTAAARFLEHMHRIDEPNLPRTVSHSQGMSSAPLAEEADTVEERAIGDSGSGEDDLLAGSQIAGGINPLVDQ